MAICCKSTRRTSPWNAIYPMRTGPSATSCNSSNGSSRGSIRHSAMCPANGCAYMFAGVTTNRHTIRTCRCGISFRDAPLGADQSLIVGVIDTLTNFVEHPEVVADRLERAAEMVGDPARILAGTDCGFDTSAGMGRVTADIVWAKLRAMKEGAELASARLF